MARLFGSVNQLVKASGLPFATIMDLLDIWGTSESLVGVSAEDIGKIRQDIPRPAIEKFLTMVGLVEKNAQALAANDPEALTGKALFEATCQEANRAGFGHSGYPRTFVFVDDETEDGAEVLAERFRLHLTVYQFGGQASFVAESIEELAACLRNVKMIYDPEEMLRAIFKKARLMNQARAVKIPVAKNK